MSYACEVCLNDVEERFECYNCELKMCFDCIGMDDVCLNCGRQGRLFIAREDAEHE